MLALSCRWIELVLKALEAQGSAVGQGALDVHRGA